MTIESQFNTWMNYEKTEFKALMCMVDKVSVPVVFKKGNYGGHQYAIFAGTEDEKIKAVFTRFADSQRQFQCHFLKKISIQYWSKLDWGLLTEQQVRTLMGVSSLALLLEIVPSTVKADFPLVYKQSVDEVQFQFVNYTDHKIKFSQSRQLLIDGNNLTSNYHTVGFTEDDCYLTAFRYLGQLYIFYKDVPKNGQPDHSTRIDGYACTQRLGRWEYVKPDLSKAKQVGDLGLAEAKKRLDKHYGNNSNIQLVSVEAVEFRDSTLECGVNGIMLPGTQEGYIVTVEAVNGSKYHLHTVAGAYFQSKNLPA